MLIYSYSEANSKANHLSKCKLDLECKDMDVRLSFSRLRSCNFHFKAIAVPVGKVVS